MRTLGIDLAARPARTAACVVDWPDHPGGEVRVELPRTGCTDAALLARMREADATGIDAPFGWPEFITRHLAEYATEGRWPLRPDAEDPDAWTSRLRHRETDRAVRRLLLRAEPPVAVNPLSVSADRIAVCAWRCAALLSQHAARDGSVLDRTGATSGVYEVYPAAALAAWGLPFKGYKAGGAGGSKAAAARAVRARILTGLAGQAGWLGLDRDPGLGTGLVVSDDHLDAFVSALVARAAATGRTVPPVSDEERRLAPTEGWIHVPRAGSLPALA